MVTFNIDGEVILDERESEETQTLDAPAREPDRRLVCELQLQLVTETSQEP